MIMNRNKYKHPERVLIILQPVKAYKLIYSDYAAKGSLREKARDRLSAMANPPEACGEASLP